MQIYQAIVKGLENVGVDTAFGGNGENIASLTVPRPRRSSSGSATWARAPRRRISADAASANRDHVATALGYYRRENRWPHNPFWARRHRREQAALQRRTVSPSDS
jgi:hypothetical protein